MSEQKEFQSNPPIKILESFIFQIQIIVSTARENKRAGKRKEWLVEVKAIRL